MGSINSLQPILGYLFPLSKTCKPQILSRGHIPPLFIRSLSDIFRMLSLAKTMSMMRVEVVLCYLFLINFAKTCDLYNQCCSPTIRGCMCDQDCKCLTFGRLSSLPPGSELQISLVVQRIVLRPDQHVILQKEAMRRVNISTCLGMCFSRYFLIK